MAYASNKLVTIESKGDWSKTTKFLEALTHLRIQHILDKYGEQGVSLLSQATPVDTGLAKSSWYYTTTRSRDSWTITFRNDDIEGGCNVIILLQYGHADKSGGFVKGRDFINPAIQPTFDQMVRRVWKEVQEA